MAEIEAQPMRLLEQEVPVSQVLAPYWHLEAKAIQELTVLSFFVLDLQR